MNGKIGNKCKKISIAELRDYLSERKYTKYIFSSNYQSNINNFTLRCSMIFSQLDILFNPNKIFMHNAQTSCGEQYVIIERAKYAYIEKIGTRLMIEIICGNVSNDIDNHTYTVVADISLK